MRPKEEFRLVMGWAERYGCFLFIFLIGGLVCMAPKGCYVMRWNFLNELEGGSEKSVETMKIPAVVPNV